MHREFLRTFKLVGVLDRNSLNREIPCHVFKRLSNRIPPGAPQMPWISVFEVRDTPPSKLSDTLKSAGRRTGILGLNTVIA